MLPNPARRMCCTADWCKHNVSLCRHPLKLVGKRQPEAECGTAGISQINGYFFDGIEVGGF